MDTLTTEATETLAATSDKGLLRTFASLTHQIDAARDARDHHSSGPRESVRHDRRVFDLRVQRDLIEAEILRRMGGRS